MKKLLYISLFALANAISLPAVAATLAIGAEVYLPPTDRTGIPGTTAQTAPTPAAATATVVADFPVAWVPAANGVIPANAIIGGNEAGRTLAVCRAKYNQGVHPGKVVGKNCNFGYGGKEVLPPPIRSAGRQPRRADAKPATGTLDHGAGRTSTARCVLWCLRTRASHSADLPGRLSRWCTHRQGGRR